MKTILLQPVNSPTAQPLFEKAEPKDLLALIPGFLSLPPESVHGDVLLIPQRRQPVRIRRLLVLVPNEEIEENVLARRVWQIADSSGFQVLYLTLSRNGSQATYQRRRLAGLAAVTAGQAVNVQSKVSTERSWIQALETALLPGDLIVCMEGHTTAEEFFRRKALGEKLAESLSMPVYLLSGIRMNPAPDWRPRIKELLIWAVFLAQLAVFFALQVEIDRLVGKPASTILFCLAFAAEIFLLTRTGEWLG